MKQELSIIKIGGNIIDKPEALSQFLNLFMQHPGKKILVHGGGKMATDMATQLGLPTQMHQGRRITSPETIKVVSMVYAGWINKSIVADLQKRDCPAIGLSGADANMIPAHKRPVTDIDYGEVGDVVPAEINTGLLSCFLFKDLVPVFCSITHDKQGHLLNTNADTLASDLAIALSPLFYTKLIYCFEQKGVLANIKDESSLLSLITKKSYLNLKAQNSVSNGMIPKLDTAYNALEAGVKEVYIKHALNLDKPLQSRLILV